VYFSGLDSLEKVQAACARGELERLYLLPPLFGGKGVPENIVHVPPGIAQMKERVDATIAELLKSGAIRKYAGTPEYSGASFVPKRIVIKAWDPQKEPAFNSVLEIW
jgi:hypothetical protein